MVKGKKHYELVNWRDGADKKGNIVEVESITNQISTEIEVIKNIMMGREAHTNENMQTKKKLMIM